MMNCYLSNHEMRVTTDKIEKASTESTADNTIQTVQATAATTDTSETTALPSRANWTGGASEDHSFVALLEAIPTEDAER